MITAYKVKFHGTTEVVVTMARTFDRVFRLYYNVYGGQLIEAYRGEEGEQVITIEYSAHWDTSWFRWPGFEEILQAANRKLNRQNIRWSEEPNDGGAWFEYLN